MSAPPTGSRGSVDFASLPQVPAGSTLRAEWWIAWGHLRSRQSTLAINLITFLAILGVMVGVGTLNIVIAVMAGFEVELRDKILGANAHIVVSRSGGFLVDGPGVADKVTRVPGVTGAAPFVYTELMIRSRFGHTGAIVKGVDPVRTPAVTHLRDDLVLGYGGELTTAAERQATFDTIAARLLPRVPELEPDASPLPGLFIGSKLQEQLHVRPGDMIQLINPLGDGTSMLGMPTPTMKSFRVAGVFESGAFEYDSKWTYANNADLQEFLKIGSDTTGVEIKVADIHDVRRMTAEIDALLGYPHQATHWQELNRKLFDALKLEKYVMGLILSMIVCVASLLIISTLLMVVLTKGREIAILKAMGASDGLILRVFIMQGTFIGVVGTALGTVLGLVGCQVLKAYGWPLDDDVYFLSQLPVVVQPGNLVAIAVAALGICFASTLVPARIAATLDPVQGLRYE